MKLNNCEIWESFGCLYIKTPNDVLLKLTGESIDNVKIIINSILSQTRLPDDSDISVDEIKEIFMLLAELNILGKNEKEVPLSSKVGIYADSSLLAGVRARLPGYDIDLIKDVSSLLNYDFLVVVSPFYSQHVIISEIGYYSYQNQIPLLFCEFSRVSFTIGPLVLPKEHTPSLNCYLKRRTVNAKSPKLFAEMISQTSKSLFKTQCFDYHYNDMYLFLLCEEISKFVKYNGAYSKHLVGMSITTNFVTYEIEKSRILKDPLSKLFTKTPFIPFNG